MDKMRILIVDDDPLARERISRMLRQETLVENSHECSDGLQARELIAGGQFDVVFLDIQLPGCDGLQVAADSSSVPRPAIIFVTAYDEFALRAFGVQATDYVLKPFSKERLVRALSRAWFQIRARRSAFEPEERLDTRATDAKSPKADRLTIRTGGRIIFIRPAEIVWVEADNNHSILSLADASKLTVRENLSSLEERLGEASFARVNRSALVNVDQVQELQLVEGGDYVVVLRNGTRLPLSRRCRDRWKFADAQGTQNHL